MACTISVWLEARGSTWFGVAEHEGRLVSTVAAVSRHEALRSILTCLPDGEAHRVDEAGSVFCRTTVDMLEALERGEEEGKRFELSPLVPEPRRGVLRAAAAIPIGYVSTYGDVARAASTSARVVGRIMSTNSLYPIVPCHRVVGSDLSLVGYGGSTSDGSLRGKLRRLAAEARGAKAEMRLEAAGGLRVQPVEWVISKAAGKPSDSQLTLW